MSKKTIISALMAFVCMLAAGVVLASCSSDNDDKKTDGGKATHVAFTYALTFDKNTLGIADVNVTYTDGNGKETTEQVKDTEWSRTVTSNSIPATFALKTSVTLKGQPDASRTYDVKASEKYSYKLLSASNKQLSEHGVASNMLMYSGVSADKIVGILGVVSKACSYDIIVNADATTE